MKPDVLTATASPVREDAYAPPRIAELGAIRDLTQYSVSVRVP
jgi:hypothetical protein